MSSGGAGIITYAVYCVIMTKGVSSGGGWGGAGKTTCARACCRGRGGWGGDINVRGLLHILIIIMIMTKRMSLLHFECLSWISCVVVEFRIQFTPRQRTARVIQK